MPGPVYCTKIASRLARTYTDKHGLKDLARELLGIDLSKQQQSSDWGADELTDAQLAYAASDVLHLHALKEKLDAMLAREGRDGAGGRPASASCPTGSGSTFGLGGRGHFRPFLSRVSAANGPYSEGTLRRRALKTSHHERPISQGDRMNRSPGAPRDQIRGRLRARGRPRGHAQSFRARQAPQPARARAARRVPLVLVLIVGACLAGDWFNPLRMLDRCRATSPTS